MNCKRKITQRLHNHNDLNDWTTAFGVSTGVSLVDKHDAAAILGISPETLKKYRLQEGSTLIAGIHYHTWNSRTIRYNPVLLADWGLNRNNPAAHQRTIEAYLAVQSANQQRKPRQSKLKRA